MLARPISDRMLAILSPVRRNNSKSPSNNRNEDVLPVWRCTSTGSTGAIYRTTDPGAVVIPVTFSHPLPPVTNVRDLNFTLCNWTLFSTKLSNFLPSSVIQRTSDERGGNAKLTTLHVYTHTCVRMCACVHARALLPSF